MTREQIKDKYHMADILQRYNLKANRAGFIRCPFHTGDNSPCLQMEHKRLLPLHLLYKCLQAVLAFRPQMIKAHAVHYMVVFQTFKGEDWMITSHMILFEEGSPIHTVVLLRDLKTGKVWRFSDGRKNVTTVEKENKKKCTNEKYRGIVIVK